MILEKFQASISTESIYGGTLHKTPSTVRGLGKNSFVAYFSVEMRCILLGGKIIYSYKKLNDITQLLNC